MRAGSLLVAAACLAVAAGWLLPSEPFADPPATPRPAIQRPPGVPDLTLRAHAAVERSHGSTWTSSDDWPARLDRDARLWLQVTSDTKSWIYAVASTPDLRFRRIWSASGEGKPTPPGTRLAFGGPLEGGEGLAEADAIYVVAAVRPLRWIDQLPKADCGDWQGKPRPAQLHGPCSRYYNLRWQAAPSEDEAPAPAERHEVEMGGAERSALTIEARSAGISVIKLPLR